MKNRSIAFIAVFTGIFLFGISMVMLGATLPMLKARFGLSEMQAGGLFSILPFGLLVGSITFGPIADKHGYRWVLSSAGLFLALGFLGIAHASSIHLLRGCIFLFGTGGGVMNGASSALVADMSENKHKIRNLNWLGAFFGIGAFCMPLALSITESTYYTTLIDIVCALSVFVALVFVFISYPITTQKKEISLRLLPAFVGNRMFLSICFFLFFQSAFESLVNNWSVAYLMERAGVTQEKALLALSFSVLGMVIMRVLTGSVLQGLNHNQVIRVALLLLATGAACLAFPASFVVKTIGLFLLGAGLAPGFPVMLGLVGAMFKEASGTAFSFAMLIALIGNISINYISGLLTELFGMGVFPLIILFEIVAMMLIVILTRKKNS